MVNDTTAARGYVRTELHDTALLAYEDPTYPALPRRAKQRVAERVEPVATSEQSNVTCVGLHEWLVDAVDGSTAAPPAPDTFGLGRSTDPPTTADQELNDEVAKVDITRFADEGTTVRFTAFVGEDEANVDTAADETLSEGGVFADDVLLNHSLFDIEYEKDSTKTMIVESAITFSDS